MGDYVIEIELVDPDLTGEEGFLKKISKDVDPELFYAILGGSPGNLGVITHFTMAIQSDFDFPGCIGQRMAWLYTQEKLERLLEKLADLSAENLTLPQGKYYTTSPQLWRLN